MTSTTIDFLERLGSDAHLRHANLEQLDALMSEAGMAPALKRAIIAADRHTTEVLLGATPAIFCGQHPPMDDEDDEGDEGDTDSDDEDENAR